MRRERGAAVDHSTLTRWVIKYAPECEKQFRRQQRPVGRSWRMDETYVKIKGKWAYLYRAVDKEGHTIDFLLTPQRDRDAAEAFLRKAIRTQGLPEKITIDQSGANTAAIKRYNRIHKTAIVSRHSKYLNNIHGSHACDSQGAAHEHRGRAPDASGAVLCLGCVDNRK
jgi:putative transposase